MLYFSFFIHQHFPSSTYFTYLSELIWVWHPLFIYFYFFSYPHFLASGSRMICTVPCRAVRRMTLAGEKNAEGALWFGGVGINFASCCFHSLIVTHQLPLPAPATINFYMHTHSYIYFPLTVFWAVLMALRRCEMFWSARRQWRIHITMRLVKLRNRRSVT